MPSSISVVASGYGDDSIRIWDLDTQYCMQIVMGHHSEIWSLDVDPQERLLVTGSANQELRVYHIHLDKHEEPSTALDAKIADLENIENDRIQMQMQRTLF
jgi:U3 small nucleolar RNA-associated protein 12